MIEKIVVYLHRKETKDMGFFELFCIIMPLLLVVIGIGNGAKKVFGGENDEHVKDVIMKLERRLAPEGASHVEWAFYYWREQKYRAKVWTIYGEKYIEAKTKDELQAKIDKIFEKYKI